MHVHVCSLMVIDQSRQFAVQTINHLIDVGCILFGYRYSTD